MKKLLTKIVGATLGLALAIGVSVGVANNREAKGVYAATSTGETSITLGPAAAITDRWAVGKGSGTANSNSTSTAWAAPNPDSGEHTYTDTMANADQNGQKWTVTWTYTGAFYHQPNGGTPTSVTFGKASNPPTTLTFVSTAFSQSMKLTAFSSKYGDNSKASTIRGKLYYDDTLIATGAKTSSSSSETKTVSKTGDDIIIPAGSVLKVVFDEMANGVKIYDICYTLAAAPTYTVSYDKNDAAASGTMTDSNSPYQAGATVTVLSNSFVAPSGKVFGHWDTNSDDSGTDYNPNDTFSISSNTTLYAQWDDAPTTPTISLNISSVSGYTGENFSVMATYANLTSNFAWGEPSGTGTISGSVTASTGNATDGTSTYSGTLTGAGTVTLLATGGGATNKTVTFTISASSVSITGLAASASVDFGKTLDLGSTITVESVGNYSSEVTWESDNEAVATVDSEGVVTGVGKGTANITVASSDYPSATMSCAVTVDYKAKMQYTANTSTNMKGDENNAERVNLSPTYFEVSAGKGEANNLPGLNSDGTIRLYNKASGTGDGSYFVITIAFGYVITNIKINFKQNESVAKVYAGENLVAGDPQFNYVINGSTVKVQNGSTSNSSEQVHINYIDISFDKTTSVVSNKGTSSSVSYHYSKDGDNDPVLTDVAVRFGGQISKALWNALDGDSNNILGYGIMLSSSASIKATYDAVREGKASVDATFEDIDGKDYTIVSGTTIKNFYNPVSTQVRESGTDYIWYLGKAVANTSAGFTRNYTAVAYIRTTSDEIVFLTETTKSAAQAAKDLINADPDDEFDNDYLEGSLAYLAGFAA